MGVIWMICPVLHAELLSNLRDGKVYIRSQGNETITITFEPVYEADRHADFIYLQSPRGDLLEQTHLEPGQLSGSFTYTLDHGAGDYTITIAGKTYRRYSIETPSGTPAVFEPNRFFINSYASPLMKKLYFHVYPGTPEFLLHGRRDHVEGLVDTVVLHDPEGYEKALLNLPQPEQHAFFPFSSHTETEPMPGFWSITFTEINAQNYCKVAFWLDGIDNHFCLDPGLWFKPEQRIGEVTITLGGYLGPAGKIGGSMGGNPIPEVMDNILYMGLESNNYYVAHDFREPFNDNADPQVIDWNMFNWDDDYRIHVMTNAPYDLELTQLFSPAQWLDHPLTQPAQMEELAELFEAYLIHHNVDNQTGMRYASPLDEPNLSGYGIEDYSALVSALHLRKSQSPYPEINDFCLLVPGSSQFSEPPHDEQQSQSGYEWAKSLYENHDEKVDGISFHLWGYNHLMNLHRFKAEVMLARGIMEEYDTDHDTNEAIVIDQTNMKSGADSSPYEVNTFYASLWWAGVLCNTIGTGQVTAINYFNTLDDEHHKKGLMYDHTNGYALKPVGHAMRYLIENIHDEVYEAASDHPEVETMLTYDPTIRVSTLILVNKGKRWLMGSIALENYLKNNLSRDKVCMPDHPAGGAERLPSQQKGSLPQVTSPLLMFEVKKLQKGGPRASKGTGSGLIQSETPSGLHQFEYLLAPETIYTFTLSKP